MGYGWLKGKCKAGKVSVYSAKTSDARTDSRFVNGRNMVMTVRTFDVQLLGRDQEAWPAIEREADRIEAVLECRRCNHRHVLVRRHANGIEALTGARLGQVGAGNVSRIMVEGMSNDVRFDVRHSGDWFEFRAPQMFEQRGTASLTCQKCGNSDTPKAKFG